ncbi:MAG: apolipoprotein N-acyltransferase [Deltaproteobacteria bacterium]|nr:apolipoprotein N-acyltransferase [Deltaproteobacteria bacterium]MBT4637776.1 apolipoprotein N-acyltransferase [Deltaproteobacteria bacterium]MBT6501178.1 apolipoprotein N-acyltransferase [Deltaproteobacteria bacterium]MBT6611371.1 apolipoprotein N-acyltransferase [Deltaproteobacteria bacterium]MBT7151476.1 apolipoprotein N-acyltransferase [Deltaproteobacteria bacterium]
MKKKPIGGILLAGLTGLLLFLSFPGTNFYLLEWFAFVPLLYALEGRSSYQAYLLGTVTGTVAVLGGFYWTANLAVTGIGLTFPVNQLFAIAYAILTGQVFAISAVLFQWCRQRRTISELVLFPVILVTVFSLFPILFNFKLGDGQSYLLPAIQAIEFTGIYGLDFILGLVNILIYRLLQPGGTSRCNWFWISCLMIPLLWFSYGIFTLQKWDARIEGWETKRIGLVQPNRKASLKRPKPLEGFSRLYPLEMKLSEGLAAEGAEIVFWPEGHFFGVTFWKDVRQAFQKRIRKMGIPLVIFDSTFTIKGGEKLYHNSSLLLDHNGQLGGTYNKIKLVPFGEYTPLIGRSRLLKWFLGDFLDTLTPGTQYVAFETTGMRIVPAICYEPLFSEFVAESIGADGKGKLLLVQSQDGWYGESSQPEQHMAATVLRAVENRVPLVHVINNGSSAAILPSGRYQFRSPPFVRGAWVVDLPYHPNSGGSFYARHPLVFISLLRVFFVVCVVLRVRKKKELT